MKTRLIGCAIVLIAVMTAYLGCKQQQHDQFEATVDRPAPSPSGKYRLVVMKGFNGNLHFASFQITTNEQYPRVLYCSKDQFRTFNTTSFFWGPGDKIWVYSGDVGTSYWTRLRDTDWEKKVFYQGQPGAPDLLKKLQPLYFK